MVHIVSVLSISCYTNMSQEISDENLNGNDDILYLA